MALVPLFQKKVGPLWSVEFSRSLTQLVNFTTTSRILTPQNLHQNSKYRSTAFRAGIGKKKRPQVDEAALRKNQNRTMFSQMAHQMESKANRGYFNIFAFDNHSGKLVFLSQWFSQKYFCELN